MKLSIKLLIQLGAEFRAFSFLSVLFPGRKTNRGKPTSQGSSLSKDYHRFLFMLDLRRDPFWGDTATVRALIDHCPQQEIHRVTYRGSFVSRHRRSTGNGHCAGPSTVFVSCKWLPGPRQRAFGSTSGVYKRASIAKTT